MNNSICIRIVNALGFTRMELYFTGSAKDSNHVIFIYNFNYLVLKPKKNDFSGL